MKKTFKVRQFAAGSCYSYILSSGRETFVVDPHISLKEDYLRYIAKNGLSVKYVIDTHTHADHFSLAAVLKKELKVPVVMHEKAISEICDHRVKDGDELTLGELKVNILYTPGHTDDAISLYVEGRLFTGDVLMIGSVGRTDFQNGSPESMFDTLQRIKQLPDSTIIFPGHDYNEKRHSRLVKEKKTNPFLLESNRDVFVRDMKAKELPKPFNIDNIIRVNREGETAAIETLSPKQAYELQRNDPDISLLDVRSVGEFKEAHIKGSLNVPINTLMHKLDELAIEKKTYIVLCRTGNRSPMAADMLLQSGIPVVKVMDGGLTRWQKDKLPVEKGTGGISLERQVRVIAGMLVFSGTILAILVSPWFLALPLFVSCGLIFAGITDNCLMASLLIRLPYNKEQYKVRSGGGTCSMS